MLNAIGLANVGVEAFCTREAPEAPRSAASPSSPTSSPRRSRTSSPSPSASTQRRASPRSSSTSRARTSRRAASSSAATPTCAARGHRRRARRTKLPVWVKMSPEAGDPVGVGARLRGGGRRRHHRDQHHPRRRHRHRDRSSPRLAPPHRRPLRSRASSPSRCASCGISRARSRSRSSASAASRRPTDAIEFLLAGATAIQVGTANFADPSAGEKVRLGIADYCEKRKTTVRDLIGRVKRVTA